MECGCFKKKEMQLFVVIINYWNPSMCVCAHVSGACTRPISLMWDIGKGIGRGSWWPDGGWLQSPTGSKVLMVSLCRVGNRVDFLLCLLCLLCLYPELPFICNDVACRGMQRAKVAKVSFGVLKIHRSAKVTDRNRQASIHHSRSDLESTTTISTPGLLSRQTLESRTTWIQTFKKLFKMDENWAPLWRYIQH